MPKDGNITASSVIEAIPGDENIDPQQPSHNSRKRRKSGDRSKSKLTPVDTNDIQMDTAVSYFIWIKHVSLSFPCFCNIS